MSVMTSELLSHVIPVSSRDSSELLATLLDNLEGMVYRCLIDQHRTLLFASEGTLQLTGYPPEDLLQNNKLSFADLILPGYRDEVDFAIKSALKNNERFEIEYPIMNADGHVVWVYERGIGVHGPRNRKEAIEGFIQDITERRKTELSLVAAEKRFRSIFENAVEGIFQTTPTGQYLVVNPALANIYGYDSPDDLTHALNNIEQQLYVSPQRRQEFVEAMQKDGHVKDFESLVYRKDKSTIWISENARAVFDDHHQLLYYEGTVEDITERKNYAQKMEYQATHDSLTGLPNRYLLNDRLQHCMNFADRYQSKIAVAFVDLDQFKFVNDSMGHEVGDALLVVMAERLQKCVREVDTVVRLGGDEFVIILTNIHEMSDINISMQRVLESVGQPCKLNDMDFVVTCSIGISIYPKDGKKPNTLLKNADSALYKAKHAGRNNMQIYTKELNHALTDRVKTEYQLRVAIEQNEFKLFYQPKVDLATGKVCGAEALIRWCPPDQPMVSPLKFIPIAEETGLIEQIGNWVLVTACKKIHELKALYGISMPISVNVSPRQFRQSSFLQTVKNVLQVTDIDPSCLELEITENCLIEDTSRFIELLHGLRSLGIQLSIDDFGTGYSSMAYLKNFPIHTLKIDKAFVSHLDDETNTAILSAMVALGKSLKLKVVAEGVETDAEQAFVKKIGCDMMQGYFFSKPLPEEAFSTMVAAMRAIPVLGSVASSKNP